MKSNNIEILMLIITGYSFSSLLIIFYYTKVFYNINLNKFLKLILIYFILFMILLVFSINITTYKDSFFALNPILSLILFKIFNILFHYLFKEDLINTSNFFQYEMPNKNSIWTHRIYNGITISISFLLPTMIFFFNYFPSKEFYKYFFR